MANPSADDPQCADPLDQAVMADDAAAVGAAVANGSDPNGPIAGRAWSRTYLELATFNGCPSALEALIQAGARVPADALETLGEMEITDYMIDPIEVEPAYARVAEILLAHGASPRVRAYDGSPLLDTFPARYYPSIHRVLLAALAASPPSAV